MANQIGSVLEDNARASAAVAHLFRDLSIGESPGEFRVRDNPHDDFSDLLSRMDGNNDSNQGSH